MRVAIIDVLGQPYNGNTLSQRGLGGSESAVISIARELAKIGVDVTVVCDCDRSSTIDGVYYSTKAYLMSMAHFDVIISSRSVRPFIESIWTADKKIVWLHDTFCDGDDLIEPMVVSGQIDEIWTLSDFHSQYISTCNHGIKRMGEVLKRKIWQTRNGVNLYDVDCHTDDKIQDKYVWNAATNKGLSTLLNDIWPRIVDKAPYATLDIIGGYYEMSTPDVQQQEWSALKEVHDSKHGVRFTGIISQLEVASYIARASFMLYPQSLPETYGISTVESLAYGTPVISGRFGAMEETAIEDACYLIDYPVDSNPLYTFIKENRVEAFVTAALIARDDTYLWKQKSNAALKVRDVCGWDTVALQWKQHLLRITGRYMDRDEHLKANYINQRVKEVFNTRWMNPEEHMVQSPNEQLLHLIVPFRNSVNYIGKCISSIAAQDYDNYCVTLIDDASDDESEAMARRFIKALPLNIQHKFLIEHNVQSVGALHNQIAEMRYISDDRIIVLLDGDDSLVNDPNIFKKINRLYWQGAEFTYGSCRSVVDNIDLIAQEYPSEVKKNKSYRDYKFAWNIPYTHLRTFKAALYHRCDKSLLADSSGNTYRAGGDVALFYALLDVADPSAIVPVRDVWVHYNDANPANDYKVNSEEQTANAKAVSRQQIRSDINERYTNTLKSLEDKPETKKILIAIPTAQNIYPQTFKSIYDLEVPDGYEVEFQYFFGYCIDQVRNLIADWVVKGYDYLFAVDYDMEFPSDTLKRLLAHDKYVVSALYRQRKPELVYEAFYEQDGSYYNVDDTLISMGGLLMVDAIGFGCCLVKKYALDIVGYPQFTYHHAIDHANTKSEDVDFCQKLAAKDIKVWLDTTIKCTHHGSTTYTI